MARARQEGSSPEPVEGLARDGPRPFPLSRLVPSAVSCGLCEPGLPAAPAAPALLPAAYLCAPTAPPTVTSTLGGPRWPGGPRSRPRGPRPDGKCCRTRGMMGARRERETEELAKWERVGGGGEPAGPQGGCGQCGLCVARSRKTEWEAGGGGGRAGSPSWNLTAVLELLPRAFSGPGATAVSQPLSPSLGPLSSVEDCSRRECGECGRTVTSGLWGGSRVVFRLYLRLFGQGRPSAQFGRRNDGGGAIMLGKLGG